MSKREEIEIKIQHLRNMKNSYQAIIDNNKQEIEELQKKIWHYEIENKLVDQLRNNGKIGGEHFNQLAIEFDKKNKELNNELTPELSSLENRSFKNEQDMINTIDSQITELEHQYVAAVQG